MENHSLSFLFFETRRSIDQHIEQTLAPSSLSPPAQAEEDGKEGPCAARPPPCDPLSLSSPFPMSDYAKGGGRERECTKTGEGEGKPLDYVLPPLRAPKIPFSQQSSLPLL